MYRPVLNGVESHHVAVVDRRGVRHVDLGPGKGTSEEDRIVGNDRSQILLLVSYPHLLMPPNPPRPPAFHRYRQLDPSTRMGGFQRCTSGRAMPPPPAGPRWDFGIRFLIFALLSRNALFVRDIFGVPLRKPISPYSGRAAP